MLMAIGIVCVKEQYSLKYAHQTLYQLINKQMSSHDSSNREQFQLQLSPRDQQNHLPELQIPSLCLKHQSTILSNLSQDSQPTFHQSLCEVSQPFSPLRKCQSVEVCKTHNKPLQIICVDDGCWICTNCAIFGCHKNHLFKSKDDLKRDISNYLRQINNIVEDKMLIDNQNTKASISNMSNLKKSQLINQVEKYITNLRILIDKIEVEAKREVNKLISQQEEFNLRALNKNEQQFNRLYTSWRIQSSHQIQTLESSELVQKLAIIYNKNTNKHQASGQQLLLNFKKEIEEIEADHKSKIGLIRIDVDRLVEEKVKKYMIVTNKVEMNLPPLPVLSHYISNGEEILLEQNQKEVDIQVLSPSQSRSNIVSSDNKSDKYNNLSFSSINPPNKMSQSFFMDKKSLQDISFRSDTGNKKNTKPFSETRILKPKSKKTNKHVFEPKIQKAFDSLLADKLDALDLTNAQLGDSAIQYITQHLSKSKCISVKLIRNKITDEGLTKIFKNFENVVSLNLSQNLLTDASVQFILSNIQKVPKLKNLILSLNKIKERNVRQKIQAIKKRGVIVSI